MSASVDLQHRRFAEEFAIDFNRTAAAIRAGYSSRTAHVQGCRLFKLPDVQQYIEEALKARSMRTAVHADRVLLELARLAFLDVRRLFDDDGSPVPIKKLDDDTAAAISGLEVVEIWEGTGADRRFVGYTKKYRLADKNTAIANCMKHLGLLKETLVHTGPAGGAVEMNMTNEAAAELTRALQEQLRARST